MAIELVADIGRLSVRFGLIENGGEPRDIRRYSTAEHATFSDALIQYVQWAGLSGRPLPSALAIAGAITGDFVNLTGSRWFVSLKGVEAILRVPPRALNECAATALALTRLAATDLIALPGPAAAPPASEGTYLVLSPGTGLGVAALIVEDRGLTVVQSEAGHMNFAPQTADEHIVAAALARGDGMVSCEALLSASGILGAYRALGGHTARTSEDVTRAAGSDPVAVRARDVFLGVLGAVAGDLVLAFGAWRGVFVAGAIARALRPQLAGAGVRRRLEAKAAFGRRLAQLPLAVVMRSDLELLGAGVALAR